MKLTCSYVDNLLYALLMRKFRNECRAFMTNDTQHITLWQQIKWYYRVYRNPKSEMKALLFFEDGKPFGYGLVRMEMGRLYVSGGITANARGRGLGKCLFATLIKVHTKAQWVWLDVREDNKAARKVYESLGFKEVERQKGIITMKRLK